MKSHPPTSCWLALCAASLLSFTSSASSQIQVYVSPPGHEQAETSWGEVPGALPTLKTETFGSLSASLDFPSGSGIYYSTSLQATYDHVSGPSPIIHNSSSGFGGPSSGNYLGLPLSSQLEITFDPSVYTAGVSYFGFYYSAGDPNNSIDIYRGSDLIFSFSTATLLTILPRDQEVTAINGSIYDTNLYYGNDGTGGGFNTGETYAYLHFLADEGVTFDRVVLKQATTGATSSTFENDNHSLMVDVPTTTPDTWVTVPVPEPSSAFLLLGGSLLFLRRRR